MKSWLDFWNAPNAIYVSARHQQAHYAKVLNGVRGFVPAGGAAIVLDWGCGDALAANELAQSCRTLLLYDRADTARRRLVSSFADQPKIRVLDDAELEAASPASIDLIIVNSVVQYLNLQEFTGALQLFHRLLKPTASCCSAISSRRGRHWPDMSSLSCALPGKTDSLSPGSAAWHAISCRLIASYAAMPATLVTPRARC
jgi:hypothetical protein